MARLNEVTRILLCVLALALFVVTPAVGQDDGETGEFFNSDDPSIAQPSVEDSRRVKELRRSARRNIETQRWSRGIEDVKSLVSLAPYNADYQLTLGLLYRKTGDLDEARRKFQEYLDLGGSQAVGHLLIGESYAASRDREKTFQYLRRAAENGMNLMKAVEQFETLQTFRDDTEFIKLALQLEKYDLESAELADPFTDRFKRAASPVGGDPQDPIDTTVLSKLQQEEMLRKAQIYVARIERALSQEDEDRAMEAYTELLHLTEEADRFTVPRLSAEFRAIIGRKEEIEARIEEIRLKYYYRQAQETIAEMRRAFKDENYPRVESIHRRLTEIARDMVRVNETYQEVADRILQVGKNWVNKAQVRREFNAKPLAIQGIVLHSGPPHAIVNNRLLRVGDRFDDMTVIQIEPNQVFFNYRGERIPLVFRRF